MFFYSGPETSSPDVTVPESVGNAEVCVTLDNPVEETVVLGFITLDGSAVGTNHFSYKTSNYFKISPVFTASDGDYVFSTNFSEFVPGEGIVKCVLIPIIDDSMIEPNEHLTVIFAVNGRETSNATVTIIDNDQIGKVVTFK